MKKFKILTGKEVKVHLNNNNLLFVPITKEQGKEFLKHTKLDAHFSYNARTLEVDFELPELKDKSLEEKFKNEPLYMELIDMLIVYGFQRINQEVAEGMWRDRCKRLEEIDIPDYQQGIIAQDEEIADLKAHIKFLNDKITRLVEEKK